MWLPQKREVCYGEGVGQHGFLGGPDGFCMVSAAYPSL